MNKKEIKYLDPESNSNSTNKLINSSSVFTNYEEELKAIQRSIALLRQDIALLLRAERIRMKGEHLEKCI